MSQEKVDKYKEFKKNRKENIEKEKRQQKRTSLIWKIVACVLALGVVAALGITIYNGIQRSRQAAPQYDREGLIVQDVAGIYATTTAEPETTEAPESTPVGETMVPSPTLEPVPETTAVAPETTKAP